MQGFFGWPVDDIPVLVVPAVMTRAKKLPAFWKPFYRAALVPAFEVKAGDLSFIRPKQNFFPVKGQLQAAILRQFRFCAGLDFLFGKQATGFK